jgi:hypothetical protein
MKNDTFLHQSALLYSSYYHLQITLHRSFIPIPSKTQVNFLPSLTICTNAARACIHLLEVEFARNDVPGAFHNLVSNSSRCIFLRIADVFPRPRSSTPELS